MQKVLKELKDKVKNTQYSDGLEVKVSVSNGNKVDFIYDNGKTVYQEVKTTGGNTVKLKGTSTYDYEEGNNKNSTKVKSVDELLNKEQSYIKLVLRMVDTALADVNANVIGQLYKADVHLKGKRVEIRLVQGTTEYRYMFKRGKLSYRKIKSDMDARNNAIKASNTLKGENLLELLTKANGVYYVDGKLYEVWDTNINTKIKNYIRYYGHEKGDL